MKKKLCQEIILIFRKIKDLKIMLFANLKTGNSGISVRFYWPRRAKENVATLFFFVGGFVDMIKKPAEVAFGSIPSWCVCWCVFKFLYDFHEVVLRNYTFSWSWILFLLRYKSWLTSVNFFEFPDMERAEKDPLLAPFVIFYNSFGVCWIFFGDFHEVLFWHVFFSNVWNCFFSDLIPGSLL